MELPSSWQQELEMQDQGFMNHYQMSNPYIHPIMDQELSVDSFSSDIYTEAPPFIDQSFHTRITKKISQTENPKPKLVSNTPSTFTISYGDVKPKDEFLSICDWYGSTEYGMNNVRTTVKNPIQVQDHVLAERKRREKLAQLFVSLSELLPNLKKVDKATVLEDAANYIQELQNRVSELEGLSIVKKKNIQESVITGKRSRLSSSDDDGSSSNEAKFEASSRMRNTEIELRTSGCSLLIEIYSRKNCKSLVKVLSELQKFGLSIISYNTMPFTDTTLIVTIVAQKNDDLIMPLEDVVKNLQPVV
ncbi:transcription factor NAI1-like [Bidens hawaiensis]|uniref:transcription factor NAI1-like n=1 Tax=Bidens hawaiensis TaxID=980011 RepID=UPI004049BD73